MSETWPKYTITALLGIVVGIGGAFGNITITSQSRIAALEFRAAETAATVRRIEDKLDKLNERK
jgi:hypothetical protein